MSDSPPLHRALEDALPRVLALLDQQRRDLFRHELQRFCATARFQTDSAREAAPVLQAMLLEAVRAARHPASIEALRSVELSVDELVRLSEHLMACWLDAIGTSSAPCDPLGMGE